MKVLCASAACLILMLCASAVACNVTVGPSDSTQLVWASYTAGRTDTVFIFPGTYNVSWPIYLTNNSPSYVGVDGPEGVIMFGTGVEYAFFLDEGTWDAHIHIEGITFRGLLEVIGRVSPIDDARGEIRFIDNIVEECGSGAMYPALRTTGCSGVVSRNEFRNNLGYGIGTYHTSASIEDNEIYGCLGGIHDQCCESPPIRGNHVHGNSGIGIDTGYADGGPIEYNIIERNGGLGLGLGSYYTVEHNIIRENNRGVACGGMLAGNAAVHYNDIYHNLEYDLQSASEGPLTHDCTMNWWGSTDPALIAEGIRDCNDDPGLNATVVFDPFCMIQGCEAVPVEPSSWGSIKALFRR